MPPTNCPEWSRDESLHLLPHVIRGMASVEKFIYRHARHHKLKHSDLKEWHRTIFRNVVPKDYYAGHFRSPDPRRPCLQTEVRIHSHRGAPFALVPSLMQEFSLQLFVKTSETDQFINECPIPAERARAALMLTAFCAGRIVQIHPFVNGNGRISRLAANFFLHRYGYRFLLERFRPRQQPITPSYETAAEACMTGDYTTFFRYLLECLATSTSTVSP